MGETDFHDRLRTRLRTARRNQGFDTPTETADALSETERSVLGKPDPMLPIKQRLQRLTEAAVRQGAARHARRRERRHEGFAGREARNEQGACLVIDNAMELAGANFDTDEAMQVLEFGWGACRSWLQRLPHLPIAGSRILGANDQKFNPARAVYLDTETTGLSGGTGTVAFLVGAGWCEGDRFVVRQYLMRDYEEEPALLQRLASDIARFETVVTFNGKQFDMPLLETRYRINRLPFPLANARHFDLLHPARRLWKRRFESCRLQKLEAELLQVWRTGDVSGQQIPEIYFDYVRGARPEALGRVLRHNHVDIVSLAALTGLAFHWVTGRVPDDSRDAYSLARVFERAGLEDRATREYERVIEFGDGPWHVPSLLQLGRRAKRAGDHRQAARHWEEAADAGECVAYRELAILHERQRRDPRAALTIVDAGQARLDAEQGCCRRTQVDFEKRRPRLLAKLARMRVAVVTQ